MRTVLLQSMLRLKFLYLLWGLSISPLIAADINIIDTICITTKDTITIDVSDGSYIPNSGLDMSSFQVLNSPSITKWEVDASLGTIKIKPGTYLIGVEHVQFRICNTGGDCYQVNLNVVVDPWNTVTPISDDIIGFVNTPISDNFYYNDFDAEGDSFYIMNGGIMKAAMSGSLSYENAQGNFTYVPKKDFTGKDRLEYIVSDIQTSPSIRNAYINTRIVKHNPKCYESVIAMSDNYIAPINGTIQGNALWNDRDIIYGTQLKMDISPLDGPFLGNINFDSSGNFTYTAARNSIYLDAVQYRVCNNNASCQSCDTSWLYIRCGMDKIGSCLHIKQPTQSGFAAGCNQSALEGNVVDPNTAPYPYIVPDTVMLAPKHGTVSWDSTGHYIYTANPGYSGPDRFGYEICKIDPVDGSRHACTKASTLLMIFNQTPIVAAKDIVSIVGSNTAMIDPLTNDFDQEFEIDSSSLKIVNTPFHGTASVEPGAMIKYTAAPGFSGLDSIRYAICDQEHLCAGATCDTAVILYDVASIMAVTFTDFTAHLRPSGEVRLDWEVPITGVPGKFKVWRSYDALEWKAIATIPARANERQYNYPDIHPGSTGQNTAYYKISYESVDGVQYSPVRSVYLTNSDDNPVILYPNPVSGGKVHLDLTAFESIESLRIYHVKGTLMIQLKDIQPQILNLDIHNWNTGIYFYEIATTRKSITGKFLKH